MVRKLSRHGAVMLADMTAERERMQAEAASKEEALKEQAAVAEKKEQALADITAERERLQAEAEANKEALKEQASDIAQVEELQRNASNAKEQDAELQYMFCVQTEEYSNRICDEDQSCLMGDNDLFMYDGDQSCNIS